MKLFDRNGRVGDARVAEIEPWGGRPVIDGDPEITQQNLMSVVHGTYEVVEPMDTVPVPKTHIGRAVIGLVEKIL